MRIDYKTLFLKANAMKRQAKRTARNQKQEVKHLRSKLGKLEKGAAKRQAAWRVPVTTDKGALLLSCDYERISSRVRHADSKSAVRECVRIANENHERVIVLRVVGVMDKRNKAEATGQAQEGSTPSPVIA